MARMAFHHIKVRVN